MAQETPDPVQWDAVLALTTELIKAGGTYEVRIVPPAHGNVVCVVIPIPVNGGFTSPDSTQFDVVGRVTPGVVIQLLQTAEYSAQQS